MDNYSQKKNIIGFAIVAFLASIFLVILGPLGIFLNNVDNFTVGLVNTLKYLSVMASSIFLILLAMAVFLPAKWSNIFARGIALVTLGSWVISNFLMGSMGG